MGLFPFPKRFTDGNQTQGRELRNLRKTQVIPGIKSAPLPADLRIYHCW